MAQGEKKKGGGMTLDKLASIVTRGFEEMYGEQRALRKGQDELRNDYDELARITATGFNEVNNRIDGLEARMDQRFGEVEDRLLSLEKGRLEDTRRFDAFETKMDCKLDGLRESLDNTVTREEFSALVVRVENLETA